MTSKNISTTKLWTWPIVAAMISLLTLLVVACAPQAFSASLDVKKLGKESYKITKVIDGDTVKARVQGKTETIRVIGINSPEYTTKRECYGAQATKQAKALLAGKSVRISIDKTQALRDKYGRLLAYVQVGGKDFGLQMIKSGHAKEYTYGKKYNRSATYKHAHTTAKAQKKGLWSTKNCPTKKTATKTTAKTKAKVTGKGVVKLSKNKICHQPGTRYYKQTKNYTGYKTLNLCLKAGGRLPKN